MAVNKVIWYTELATNFPDLIFEKFTPWAPEALGSFSPADHPHYGGNLMVADGPFERYALIYIGVKGTSGQGS